MSCLNQLAAGGDLYSSNPPFNIYLYPNYPRNENEVKNTIANKLKDASQQLLEHGSIDFYDIEWVDDHPYIEHDKKKKAKKEFGNWLKNNGCDSDTNYHDLAGAHLLVSGKFKGGVANGADGGAFVNCDWAVVGTDYHVGQYWGNLAIQEVLHLFLDNEEISGLTEGNEHDLGEVTDSHASTPMATSYEGQYSDRGSCDNAPGYWELYDQNLTSCTKDGVKWSWEDRK